MRRLFSLIVLAGVAVSLSGCASTPTPSASPEPTNTAVPTVDPNLIPKAPAADAIEVDPETFAASFGDYTFLVGEGPTWCSINVDNHLVVCEQSEAQTNYKPVPAPSSCELSYGYQLRLTATAPTDGTDEAGFVCSGSAYADPSGMVALNPGEVVKLDTFTCFVEGVTARCDNENNKYIVLGPDAWAFGSTL